MKLNKVNFYSFKLRIPSFVPTIAEPILKYSLLISGMVSVIAGMAQFTTNHGILDSAHVHTGIEYGSGVSFYDFNNDGWDDLTFGSGTGPIHFYENNNGTLETVDFGIENSSGSYVTALLWADYDNDGDEDLLIIKKGSPPQLWRNSGNFTFVNVAPFIGIEQGNYDYYGAAFCDYDHDGCLDLYISKFYSYSSFGEAQPSILYKNNCNGTFEDVTEEAGVLLPWGPVFQPVFVDLNGDGWEDLYLILDKVDFPNELFINNQDGTFTQVTSESGAGVHAAAMTGTVGDYDNDSDLDIFISNDPVPHNILLQNDGSAQFTDVTSDMGLVDPPINPGWGGLWIDYNNNTWQDLFYGTVTSQFAPPSGNRFYLNQEGDGFLNWSENIGIFDEMLETFVCAKGDINNDGYPDFFTNNRIPFPSKLYLNQGGENNYLAVKLQGTFSNKNGIGSWIHCYANGHHYVRHLSCGENFKGQDSGREIFGLGEFMIVDSLVIDWNRGTQDVLYNVDVNQTILIIEGSTQNQPFSLASQDTLFLCENDTIVLTAGNHLNYQWNTGSEEQEISITEPGTFQVEVTNIFGFTVNSNPLVVLSAPVPDIQLQADHVTCSGVNDGSIWISASNGTILSILWNTGESLPFITDLDSGLYYFEAMDFFNCPFSDSIHILEPDSLILELVVSDVLCAGDSSGSVDYTVSGGTPPYVFDWSGITPSTMGAGNYSIAVTDWNFCSASADFTISQPDSLQINLDIQHAQGSANNGQAMIEVDGGVPPYSIEWSIGVIDTTQIFNLSPGQYSVGVEDSNGCTWNGDFEIDFLSQLDHQENYLSVYIYPNPVQSILHVELPQDIPALMTLMDQTGRKISDYHWSTNDPNIDLNGLATGLYVLYIQQGEKIGFEKLLVTK